MLKLNLFFGLSFLFFGAIHAHGTLQDPPARASAWTFGFNHLPADYNHLQGNCGGVQVCEKVSDNRRLLILAS